MITKYVVLELWEKGKGFYSIGVDCIGAGIILPPRFTLTPIGKLEAEQLVFNLTEWYKLPVDEKVIMSHFNKEILK
jgi:hypothetical protein